MGTRERRGAEIQDAIAAVLLNDWDPIGVREVPEAADEYDSYVGRVYRLLAAGASARDIAEHLKGEEESLLGSRTSVEALIPVAQKLRSIDVSL